MYPWENNSPNNDYHDMDSYVTSKNNIIFRYKDRSTVAKGIN